MKINKKPLGIYIHIPFCEKKCDYCDFLSAPASENTKEQYVQALMAELSSRREMGTGYWLKSVFFGGGTPSSLLPGQISCIMQGVRHIFPERKQILGEGCGQSGKEVLSGVPEITLEANPGTLTREKLMEYRACGINRLSIGLQSADNQELKQMGRIHSFEEFLDNYRMARSVGFENINIDLISGLPGQTISRWENTLEQVAALKPEHISAYSLIIEEGTPFYQRYGEGTANDTDLLLPDEETDRLIYEKTKEFMLHHGWGRYEISNYALPGWECIHNSIYWQRGDYLGIGLGASSLIEERRLRNPWKLAQYLEQAGNPDLYQEEEVLTIKQQMEEFMFLGLRMSEGISVGAFLEKFHKPMKEVYGRIIEKQLQLELVKEKDGRMYLTDYGIDISNTVLAEYLLD